MYCFDSFTQMKLEHITANYQISFNLSNYIPKLWTTDNIILIKQSILDVEHQ